MSDALDRNPQEGASEMRLPSFYISDSISKNRHIMPDGSLLCVEVPVASLAPMTYRSDEIPGFMEQFNVKPGVEIVVVRTPDALFNEATIASFNTVTITLGHPDIQDVDPDNYRSLTRGVTTNVRQGEGDFEDCLVADLVIRDKEAIDAVLSGSAQYCSCGYDSMWVRHPDGTFGQTNITGNHVALVNNPRGGHKLKIQDSQTMVKKNVPGLMKRLGGAIQKISARDDAGALADLNEVANELQAEVNGEQETSPGIIVINGAERAAEPPPVSAPVTTEDELPSPEQAAQQAAGKTKAQDKILEVLSAIAAKLGVGVSSQDEAEGSLTQTSEKGSEQTETSNRDDDGVLPSDDNDMMDAVTDDAIEEGIMTEDEANANPLNEETAMNALGAAVRDSISKAAVIDPRLRLGSVHDAPTRTLRGAAQNLHAVRLRIIDSAVRQPELAASFREHGYRRIDTQRLSFRDAGRLCRIAANTRAALNNSLAVHDSRSDTIFFNESAKITPATINEKARAFYKRG